MTPDHTDYDLTTLNTVEIAGIIVGEMNEDQRAEFDRGGWYEGVSLMLVEAWEGADLDDVLDAIESRIGTCVDQPPVSDALVAEGTSAPMRGVWHS